MIYFYQMQGDSNNADGLLEACEEAIERLQAATDETTVRLMRLMAYGLPARVQELHPSGESSGRVLSWLEPRNHAVLFADFRS
jgi:hypothetical protein